MGDHLSVDIAQASHLAVLNEAGSMTDSAAIHGGAPLPADTDIFEVLCIDDHGIIRRHEFRRPWQAQQGDKEMVNT